MLGFFGKLWVFVGGGLIKIDIGHVRFELVDLFLGDGQAHFHIHLQLFSTGVLGQYLSKTYLETKRRPIYITKETEEIYLSRKKEAEASEKKD